MTLYFIISIFILFIVLLEISLRFYFGLSINKLHGKDLFKFILNMSKDDFNKYRFSVQASYMGLKIDDLHKIMAKANQIDPKTIAGIYSGSKAVEKLTFRPFIGFSTSPRQTLSYTDINELGLQSTFKNYIKPPNTKRVLILGSSAAYGIGCTSKSSNLTYKLQQKLTNLEKNSSNQYRWEVINLAFVGSQSISEYNQFIIYASMFSPDFVIHLSGFNDLYFHLEDKKLYTYNFYRNVINSLSYFKTVQYFKKRIYIIRLLSTIKGKLKPSTKSYEKSDQIYTVW